MRGCLVGLAVVLSAPSAHAETITFDQAQVCLSYASSLEALRVAIELLPYRMAATKFNASDTWKVADVIEQSARRHASISRDSTYLVPWGDLEKLAETVRFANGFRGPFGSEIFVSVIIEDMAQLKERLTRDPSPDLALAQKVQDLARNFGEPTKIRSICGRAFLGQP